jgi:hypothetical protein
LPPGLWAGEMTIHFHHPPMVCRAECYYELGEGVNGKWEVGSGKEGWNGLTRELGKVRLAWFNTRAMGRITRAMGRIADARDEDVPSGYSIAHTGSIAMASADTSGTLNATQERAILQMLDANEQHDDVTRVRRILMLIAAVTSAITVIVVAKAIVAPGNLASWLPLFGPIMAIAIACNMYLIADFMRMRREEARAARAMARLAAEPELACALAERRDALLRDQDSDA